MLALILVALVINIFAVAANVVALAERGNPLNLLFIFVNGGCIAWLAYTLTTI